MSETQPSKYGQPTSNEAPDGVNAKGTYAESSLGGEPGAPIDSYFEMVEPPGPAGKLKETRRALSKDRTASKRQANGRGTHQTSSEDQLFVRRKVPPIRAQTSALTAKLASSNTSTNPFTELYALISGRAEVSSMEVIVFFPHAKKPSNKPLNLTVRKDATIEEVIGFALWSYWEESWLPMLDEDGSEEQKNIRLSATGWVLRIAEDDGEVDEDFPGMSSRFFNFKLCKNYFVAPDRMGKISKFNFDAYAILEANPAQGT